MPVATPFTSFGSISDTNPSAALFTGFPYCAPALLVDSESGTYWTSLSGWSKDNEPVGDAAKAASIAESQRLAMALFWNSYELKGEASHDAEFYGPVSVTDSGPLITEPKDRACVENIDDFPEQNTTDANNDATAEISFKIKIVRLFLYVEGGEDQFVGYGVDEYTGDLAYLRSDIFAMAEETDDSGWIEGSVSLGSVFYDSFIVFSDIDYTTISNGVGDFHFVCFVIGDGASAANRTASNADTTVQIDGFDFYTYPT